MITNRKSSIVNPQSNDGPAGVSAGEAAVCPEARQNAALTAARPTGGREATDPPPAADSQSDRLLTVAQVAAALPLRPTVTAVYRWIHLGVKLPGGKCVRLAATRYGGRWRVRLGDFLEFLKALNPDRGGQPARIVSDAELRRRQQEETKKRLEGMLGPINWPRAYSP